jgi:hypothetical protein
VTLDGLASSIQTVPPVAPASRKTGTGAKHCVCLELQTGPRIDLSKGYTEEYDHRLYASLLLNSRFGGRGATIPVRSSPFRF